MMNSKLQWLILLALLPAFGLAQYDMKVRPGTTVTVKSNANLNIRNGGDLLLQDDYDHAPSFLSQGTVSINGGGKAKVEQYVTRDAWHMVSSPTNNEQISAYMWMYLYKFLEPNNSWKYLYQPITTPIEVGKGYFLYSYSEPPGGYPAAGDSAILKGTLNYQNVNVQLSNTPASPKTGWNLLGNPFPCALNWNGSAAWNLNNVGASMYITNPQTGNYDVWNYNTGGTNSNEGYIAATQGFWVRSADTSGNSSSITIPASERCHNPAEFLKSGGPYLPEQLLLTLKSSTSYDKTIVGFILNSSSGFDPDLDAEYISESDHSPSIFSLSGNERYVMNHYPSLETHSQIPLGLIFPEEGLMAITCDWIESFPSDIPVFLQDRYENIWTNLRETDSYSFSTSSGEILNRFILHFSNPDNSQSGSDEDVLIYSWSKTIYINIPFETEAEIRVYNLMGQKVAACKGQQGINQLEVDHSKLHYVVKVLSNRGISTRKVYIN